MPALGILTCEILELEFAHLPRRAVPGGRHIFHDPRLERGLGQTLFTGSGYERSLLIPNGLLSEEAMKENSEEFNRTFDLRTETRPGTLDLLKQAWNSAKHSLLL